MGSYSGGIESTIAKLNAVIYVEQRNLKVREPQNRDYCRQATVRTSSEIRMWDLFSPYEPSFRERGYGYRERRLCINNWMLARNKTCFCTLGFRKSPPKQCISAYLLYSPFQCLVCEPFLDLMIKCYNLIAITWPSTFENNVGDLRFKIYLDRYLRTRGP